MSSNQYPGNSPSPIRQIAKRLLSAALPRPMFITHGRSSLRSVCLTFDDGPHPEVTPRLLDLLARENVAATFFVLGSLAVRYPDIIKRVESEGHTVGNHSCSHPDPVTTSALAMHREVRQSDEILRGILRASHAALPAAVWQTSSARSPGCLVSAADRCLMERRPEGFRTAFERPCFRLVEDQASPRWRFVSLARHRIQHSLGPAIHHCRHSACGFALCRGGGLDSLAAHMTWSKL